MTAQHKDAPPQHLAGNNSSLRMRALSAALLAPMVLGIVYMGGAAFTLMLSVAAMIGAYEWARMVLSESHHRPRFLRSQLAGVAGVSVMVSSVFSSPVSVIALLSLGFAGVLAVNILRKGPSLWRAFLGVIYISFACAIMIWLRAGDSLPGLYHLLLLLLIVWASDIGAYFSGKTIGGPKLAPSISPKKTWAGFLGSSLAAGAVATWMGTPSVVASFETVPLADMSGTGYFILGFVLAMFGQVGDLMISVVKRRYGFKDSGALIPGHGGILDRVDALILVALAFGCFISLF